MKKLKILALLAAAALFFSCSNASSGSDKDDDKKPAPETTTTTEESGDCSNGGNNSQNGSTINNHLDPSFNEPNLPENVGDDPFKGKAFFNPDTCDRIVFGQDGGTYTAYSKTEKRNAQGQYYWKNTVSNMKYTYNATDKKLYACAISYNDFLEENKLFTYQDIYNYINTFSIEEYRKNIDPDITEQEFQQILTKSLNYQKEKFETLIVEKSWLEDSDPTEFHSYTYYKKLDDPLSIPMTFYYDFTNESLHTDGAFKLDKSDLEHYGNLRLPPYAISNVNYVNPSVQITQITEDTITVETYSDTPKTYTFTYTTAWNDGEVTLSITGKDDVSKDILANQEWTYSSKKELVFIDVTDQTTQI